ncbi:MAG: hypothetical protein HWD83_08525 [Gammaproteobacteria bacterium]|nr:hypothetical protein [Gammaproteobacteria bacterium]
MKLILSNVLLVVVSQMLMGCELTSTSRESAAHIPVHSEKSLAELRESAQALFNGRQVSIGTNAFANSNKLFIQRTTIRSPDGSTIDSRVDEPPFILELFLRDNDCYLRHSGTGEEVRLSEATCIAM